jgi:hypothetical protein
MCDALLVDGTFAERKDSAPRDRERVGFHAHGSNSSDVWTSVSAWLQKLIVRL